MLTDSINKREEVVWWRSSQDKNLFEILFAANENNLELEVINRYRIKSHHIIYKFISRFTNMEPHSHSSEQEEKKKREKEEEIKKINLGALTELDDEAINITKGPIKVQVTSNSRVSECFFFKINNFLLKCLIS